MSLTLFIILLIFFLVVSFFFSASETALMAINRLRLSYQADTGEKKAQTIKEIVSNPDRLLGVILLGNTVSNVAAATLVTYLVAEYAPLGKTEAVSVFASLGLTVIILIFCELTPKIISAGHADEVARRFLWPVRLALLLLAPFARVSTWFANRLVRILGAGTTASPYVHPLTDDDIRAIISASGPAGLAGGRREMLSNVLDIAATQIREVMIPRVEVTAVDIDDPVPDTIALITRTKYSRMPVYRGNFDNVVGILNVKDMLPFIHRAEEIDLQVLLRPVQFVPDTARLDVILRQFQSMHLHMAVVVDEYGGVEGIVTLEDLLEEIVGEIRDEHDTEMEAVRDMGAGLYTIAGNLPVKEFNRFFRAAIPESPEYTTIVGFLQTRTGRLLQKGETVRYQNFSFSVESAEGLRVVSLRVRVPSAKPEQIGTSVTK